MKYFSIEELTRSAVAKAKGIVNEPPQKAVDNLIRLAEAVLDPIREAWGGPIRVNSGYRSEALNRAVGGVRRSQHTAGQAADITVGSVKDNRRLFEMIRGLDIPFDQLINEGGGRWIHISHSERGRREILNFEF